MRYGIFLATLASLLPTLAFAQSSACAPGTYRLIAPIGGLTECLTLTEYLSGVFLITIGLAGVLAVVMVVVCGIQMMMSGSVSGKSAAKECIWNALFGLLIALGAWAILYTINPELLRSDIALIGAPANVSGTPPPQDAPMPTTPGWYFRYGQPIKNSPMWTSSEACESARRVEEKNGVTVLQTPPGSGIYCFPIYASATPPPAPPGATPPPPPVPGIPAGEENTRNAICGNTSCIGSTPVGINNGPCIPSTANMRTGGLNGTGCTNVNGLPGDTISFIKGLSGSAGSIVITGGTENGHSSHAQNMPIFDLRKTTALVSFILKSGTGPNPSFCNTSTGKCYTKWLYGGYWFTDEGDHYHVCKDGTTSPTTAREGLFRKACTKI